MSLVVDLNNNVETTKSATLRTPVNTETCKLVKTSFKYEKGSNEFQLDKNLFTFKPKLNPKSHLLAQNLISFYERQNLHSRKQLEMVSKILFIYFLVEIFNNIFEMMRNVFFYFIQKFKKHKIYFFNSNISSITVFAKSLKCSPAVN